MSQKHSRAFGVTWPLKRRSIVMETMNIDGAPLRVLVLGATSDLGQRTCLDLANKGYELLLIGRNEKTLGELAESLPGQHKTAVADLNMPDELTPLIIDNAKQYGAFKGAVFCAGVHAMTTLRQSSYADFEQIYRVNCGGALAMIKAFTRKSVRNTAGTTSLVLLSSVSQSAGEAGISGYAASKGALGSLSRCAALELAKDRVLVNCIAAGMIQTKLNDGYQGMAQPGHFEKLASMHPLGFGSPEHVSKEIINLLESEWTTGSTVYVDGGYTCA